MSSSNDFKQSGKSRRRFLRNLAALPIGTVVAKGTAAQQQSQHGNVPTSSKHTQQENAGIYGKRPPIFETDPFAPALTFSKRQLAPKVVEFELSEVTLGEGPLKDAREWNRAYMLRLAPGRLLHNFRVTAGIPSNAQPLGGWEAPSSELRGHFVGHYLSACGHHFAATGDNEIKARGDEIVAGIAECQSKLNAGGYVSAFPETLFVKLDERKPVWAPFYTLHKIMAGLLDMAEHGENQQALDVLLKLAAWVDSWTAAHTEQHMQDILNVEYGGMNEVLYNLSGLTNDPRWAVAGDRFTKKKFFNPLGMRRDELIKLHANTHIPQVIGAARRYELSSDYRFFDVASFFFDTVSSVRTYATGGSSNNEVWQTQPNHLSLEFKAATHHQECCCAYNMMKLSRHLYRWSPDVRYVDYYERNLYNHRLGMIQPETGLTSYFLSMTPGAWKTLCTEDQTFWCCTGTALEDYAKINSSIYAHDHNGVYVNLFAASELNWKNRGIRIRQVTTFPQEPRTSLIIEKTPAAKWPLRLRIPSWTDDRLDIRINGLPLEAIAAPGGYLTIQRKWRPGDTVDMYLPMRVVAEPLQDDPSWSAFVYGPIVLAGQFPLGDIPQPLMHHQGPEVHEVPIDVPSIRVTSLPEETIAPVSQHPLHFTAQTAGGPVLLKPINQSWERFAVYWKLKPLRRSSV